MARRQTCQLEATRIQSAVVIDKSDRSGAVTEKVLSMAVFVFSNAALSALTAALNVGIDSLAEGNDAQEVAALIEELEAIEARSGDVEITVMGSEIELGGNGPGQASDFYGMADGTEGDQAGLA